MPDRDEPPAGLNDAHRPVPVRAGRLVGLAVGLALLAAVALWAAFTGAGPARLDDAALTESLEDRTPGLTAVAIVVTNLGSTVAMAVLAVGAMAGASLVFRVLKTMLYRSRPPAVDQLVPASNESLPSGHATMSIVVIGTIVVLAWSGRSARGRTAMVAAAVLWVGAVGATRVYLGVHWVSDVLAGWAVGAAWLAVCVGVWARWRARVAPVT